jgi:DNA-binding NtrC family response regulator
MKRILVVDDEPLLRQGFEKALQTDVTEVTTVETGGAALSEIASCHYHLCFLDIFLKDMNGTELLKKISEISPMTKVIVMTAGIINDAMTKTIEKYAHMFITKPFDLLQVKMLVKGVIEEPELKSAPAESRSVS